MTRGQTLIGYAAIASAMVVYHLAGWRARRTPTLGELVGALATWPPTRWLLLAGWLWLGWHLFVRVGWR